MILIHEIKPEHTEHNLSGTFGKYEQTNRCAAILKKESYEYYWGYE